MAGRTANEEVTWEAIERWNQGKRDVLLELVEPDTELHSRLGELRGKPYVGADGIREWIADIDEQFSSFELKVDELKERQPGRVVAIGSVLFRGRSSDLPWEQDTVWILDFSEGRLRRFHIYTDLEKGLRAAGPA